MLLGDNGAAGLLERGNDSRLVQRLHGRDVKDLGADSLGLEGLSGLKGLPYEVSAGDDGHVLALVEVVHLADHERLLRVGEVGHRRAAEAQVHGAVPLGGGNRRLLCLVEVAGHHDRHSGKGTHEGDVLHGLVSRAVLTQSDAGMRGGYLHVGVTVGHFLAQLVVHAAGHELGERADERHLAGDCEAGGNAYHVGFCDAALDEPLRELGCEGIHLERPLEVCGEGKNPFVLASGFHEPCSEAASGIYLTLVCVFFHINNLLKFLPTVPLRRRTARRWGLCRAICGCRP